MEAIVAKGTEGFGLGQAEQVTHVEGGLSNDMWRVTTPEGDFAVKIMRAHAEEPDFRRNIEASFRIETNAFRSGVPCPEPRATLDGCALLRVDDHWLRAHRWSDGATPTAAENIDLAGDLLAQIHRAGHEATLPLKDQLIGLGGWCALAELTGLPGHVSEQLRIAAPALDQLESRTLTCRGEPTPFIDSHGDLDPKNTLLVDERLLAVDWDAAGPRSYAREAVTLALDWSCDINGFRLALAAYSEASDRTIPKEPWVFGGWVEGLSGWLAYNAEQRADDAQGLREVSATCTRLLTFHRALEEYVSALEKS